MLDDEREIGFERIGDMKRIGLALFIVMLAGQAHAGVALTCGAGNPGGTWWNSCEGGEPQAQAAAAGNVKSEWSVDVVAPEAGEYSRTGEQKSRGQSTDFETAR